MNECYSCGENEKKHICAKSQRSCGHHCNHSWTHDTCCWCGKEWEGDTEMEEERLTPKENSDD